MGLHEDKKTVIRDPNGTLAVARGISQEEAREKREKLAKKAKLQDVQKFIGRNSRLDALRVDDQSPNLEKLNEKQKLSITRRRQRTDKVTTAKLETFETKRIEAAVQAAEATEILQSDQVGVLEPEHDMERTTAMTQAQLKHHLDPDTARHMYDLTLLAYAPYGMKYDRSGRYSILFGQKGHLAMMDNHTQSLQAEFHVNERVRDARFLHNFTMFGVAQKSHVFIYDHTGAEIHRLSDHNDPFAIDFLPYHWLLVSIGRAGWLKYQDTTTGELVSSHRTHLGACSVLRQNPSNAVMHAGHSNGVVTLWSPAQSQYLAKMLCHKGSAVHSLAIDPTGKYMVTGGADRQVRVWDLRMYKETHAYFTAAGVPTSLDISQRGILGIGHAGHATFWSAEALRYKVKDPYMHHLMPRCGPVNTLHFRPYEDVCGIGHTRGISSIVIPGSGEPSLDTAEFNVNPEQDATQRRDAEVRALLDKLHPDMITLEINEIGGIEESDPHRRYERIKDVQEAANSKVLPKKKETKKKRGRSKIQTKLRRKHKNIVDQNVLKLREAREKEKSAREAERQVNDEPKPPKDAAPSALRRFF